MSFLVLCPDKGPDMTLSENSSCFDLIWETGKSIAKKKYDLSKLEFISESRHKKKLPDFAITDSGCLVVSQRLKDFFTSSGVDNIEYFPATVVEYKKTQPMNGYYAANIVALTDCINMDLSEVDIVKKGGDFAITNIDELVLKEPFPDFGGFITRAYKFRSLILIDSIFKQKLIKEKFKGLKLIEPERWDGFDGEI